MWEVGIVGRPASKPDTGNYSGDYTVYVEELRRRHRIRRQKGRYSKREAKVLASQLGQNQGARKCWGPMPDAVA